MRTTESPAKAKRGPDSADRRQWVLLAAPPLLLTLVMLAGAFTTRAFTPASDGVGTGNGRSPFLTANRAPAPDFNVAAVDGSQFRLSDHQGQAVVIMFASVGCASCATQLPGMARIHDAYKGRAAVLALNVLPDYTTAEFVAYAKRFGGGDHPYATDEGQKIAAAYGIRALGETIFIDQDGNVASHSYPPDLSYEELQQTVDQLLQ